MTHVMPELPYGKEELAPGMSRETLDFHYGKHLQTYVDNLNKLIPNTPFEHCELEEMIQKADGAIFNNAAQVWNHTFFFEQLLPRQTEIPARLQEVLVRDFGSVEAFQSQFTKVALGLFGSGWVWLVLDESGHLQIMGEPNAGNPLRKGLQPILTLDVWEHAYYIDYRNRRAAFVEAFWKLVDWNKVAAHLHG